MTSTLLQKRKLEPNTNEILTKKDKKESLVALCSSLTSQFPDRKFRLNKSGDWVERVRKDGQYRRACIHGRFSDECSDQVCLTSRQTDKTIIRRKVVQKNVPVQSDPFSGREHLLAPTIAFSGNFENANQRLQQYLKVWRQIPNTKMQSPCIFSTGASYKAGQGCVNFEGRTFFAHVFSWMVSNNREVPDGYIIRHKCCNDDNYGCAQPLHLEIGTKRQNMFEDKIRDGTLITGEQHHFSTLTNEKALEIFNSKGQGTRSERAVRFNVSLSMIKKIDGGESWSFVTGKHNFSIRARERTLKKRQERPRHLATRADYENAIRRIEARNYACEDGKGCIYSTYCRDICGYPLASILGHQTRCSILTYEFYFNNCTIKPKNLFVLHKCDDEHCVNKEHLYLGTPSQNQLDRWQRTGFKHMDEEEKEFEFASEEDAESD